jgi:5'-nucleotidase
MTFRLTRRALAATALALPALRRAGAQASARITLLHLNDFHSRHEGAQGSGAGCREGAACFGGSARLVGGMQAARAAAEAAGRGVLALDAGDQFMGSLFYTQHRGLTEAAVQRAWGVQAMAPGNHEFNHGPANLARFIRALGAPMLAANLETAAEPELRGLVAPHAVFTVGGARIGVVGLALEGTPSVSSPGPNLRFTAAEEATARSVAVLRASGPITILVLSHRGLGADRALAAAIPGIDAIIGGHSHTHLPEPVLAGVDRDVRIVQAGALGRWIGRLDLDLAADGRVAAAAGNTVDIGATTPEHAPTAALIAAQAAPLAALRARRVGEAAGAFDITACRVAECGLGNLIADAMLAAAPTADVALMNAGGIRATLPAGTVTLGDVLTVLPFGNTVATARLRGADLLAALEHGLSRAGGGGFPQLGGIVVEWSPQAPAGQRLRSARITQGPKAGPVQAERDYVLVTNNFLRGGGDAYAMLRDRALEAYDAGPPLEDALAERIARGPVSPALEGRLIAR